MEEGHRHEAENRRVELSGIEIFVVGQFDPVPHGKELAEEHDQNAADAAMGAQGFEYRRQELPVGPAHDADDILGIQDEASQVGGVAGGVRSG